MKVVCIDNTSGNTRWGYWKHNLEVGVVYDAKMLYETTGGAPAQLSIICDDGIVRNFLESRFISVEEWRQRQLGKLGI